MAWPASADAVIATANTQTVNIDAFIQDVLTGADTTLIQNISVDVSTYKDDPDWVDPEDGVSVVPQIPDMHNVVVSVISRGEFSATAATKLLEVKDALGL